MKKKVIGIVLAGLILSSGCVTTLTSEAAGVRIVESKSEYDCSFVTTLSAYNSMGIDAAQDSENALNDLRNKAAKAGMNGVRILNIGTTTDGTSVTAEGLRCKFDD
jgi:hypothetical protein